MTVAEQEHAPSTDGDNVAPIMQVDGLKTYFFTRKGTVKAVDGVSFRLKPRKPSRSSASPAAASRSPLSRSCASSRIHPAVSSAVRIKFDGVDLMKSRSARCANPRQRHLDDLPGADDVAQPGHHRRHQITEALILHQDMNREQALARRSRCSSSSASPSPTARQGIPAPAVGRHAPARHDRDGARL